MNRAGSRRQCIRFVNAGTGALHWHLWDAQPARSTPSLSLGLPRAAVPADGYLAELVESLLDADMPVELRQLGRTLRRFRNYRLRVLLYAGAPNWDRLATLTPITPP